MDPPGASVGDEGVEGVEEAPESQEPSAPRGYFHIRVAPAAPEPEKKRAVFSLKKRRAAASKKAAVTGGGSAAPAAGSVGGSPAGDGEPVDAVGSPGDEGGLDGLAKAHPSFTMESAEDDIPEEERNHRALVALGGLAIVLVLAGLFVLLSGGDDEDQVATPGATTVSTTTAPGAGQPGAEAGPGVSIEFTAAGAVLSGPVPSEDKRQQVIGGAKLLFQPGVVNGDALAVAAGAPEINPNEDALLRCLGEPVLQGVGAIGVKLSRNATPGVIVIGGTVATQLAKDRIMGAVAGVAGGLDKIVDNLQVAGAPVTTTTAAGTGPTTTAAPGATTAAPTTAPPTTTAPTSEAGEVQKELDLLFASKVVEFDTASAALTPQWESTVDAVAAALQGNEAQVQIAGHTDNVGDPAANLALSVQRAETIKLALIGRGIAADRLTTVGYGPDRPIADNATPEGRQRNRRIEFVVAAR